MNKAVIAIIGISMLLYLGCSEDPNALGGDPNLEFTTVGSRFGVFFDSDNRILRGLNTDFYVTKNDRGNIEMAGEMTLSPEVLAQLDTLVGTHVLPQTAKAALIERYLVKYNISVDSSLGDGSYKLSTVIRSKVTSEGIQDYFFTGDNRPFTLVKYNAKVGDTYSITAQDNERITRTVTRRSTDDDYPLIFWLIKVITVEQTSDDPLIEKIIYQTNHKFGLVGIEVKLANGEEAGVTIVPPHL